MKIIKFILPLILLISLNSCIIYEDYTFHSDGKIDISYHVDGSKFAKMGKSENSGKIDTIINFSDYLNKDKAYKKDEIDQIAELFKNFQIKILANDDKMEYDLRGTLNNVEELNKAVLFLQEDSLSKIIPLFNLKIKNKKFIRENISSETISSESKEGLPSMILNSIITYNFDQPVKKVSDKNAVISKDRKKVTIEYSPEDYSNGNTNIEIDLE